MSDEDLKSELERLRQENAALKNEIQGWESRHRDVEFDLKIRIDLHERDRENSSSFAGSIEAKVGRLEANEKELEAECDRMKKEVKATNQVRAENNALKKRLSESRVKEQEDELRRARVEIDN